MEALVYLFKLTSSEMGWLHIYNNHKSMFGTLGFSSGSQNNHTRLARRLLGGIPGQWRSVADNQDGAGGPICLLIAIIDGPRH
jgi:hypothetical protein